MNNETNNHNGSSLGFFGVIAVLSAVCVIGSSVWMNTKAPLPVSEYSSGISVSEDFSFNDSENLTNAPEQTEALTEEALLHENSKEKNLILVNADNPIPDGYDTELTILSNGLYVASEIYDDLQAMFDDMRAQDIYPVVGEGYRTHEQQQKLMDDKILSFQNSGYSYEQAVNEAEKWVAVPGTSEHELGLAVDINADYTRSSNTTVYEWLANYAHYYGFIQRYPADKTDITGIDYEPWHYRWVGRDTARKIYDSGLCLEEYLETIS